jgi:aspartate kinase
MSAGPLVLKLGGDALATPELIAAAARRIVAERQAAPLVVVTSARRGVTDHLIALAEAVTAATGGHDEPVLGAERAIATGEIVTAALLAAALERLGLRARALDAREAGLEGGGPPTAARLRRIRRGPLRRLLAEGVTPVVAGFQVAERGTIRLLGRGGSDLTAVAIAVAHGAPHCAFFKRHGLRLADPRQHPDARVAGAINHAALDALLADCGQLLHAGAARLAARHRLPLRFVTFPGDGPESWVATEIGDRRSEIGGNSLSPISDR